MTITALDTIVAGVRCREVLADLSEYLDGALPPSRVVELQAHLAGCDNCARFGGHVADTLAALRQGETPLARDLTTQVLARIGGGLSPQAPEGEL